MEIKLTGGEIKWLSQDPAALESLITYHGISQDTAYNVGFPSYYEDARILELKQAIKKLEDEL